MESEVEGVGILGRNGPIIHVCVGGGGPLLRVFSIKPNFIKKLSNF